MVDAAAGAGRRVREVAGGVAGDVGRESLLPDEVVVGPADEHVNGRAEDVGEGLVQGTRLAAPVVDQARALLAHAVRHLVRVDVERDERIPY